MSAYNHNGFSRQQQQSDPEIAKTHNHLGLIHARLGNVNRVIEHFQKSLQIWPGNIDTRKNLQLFQRIQEKQPNVNPS